MEKRINEMEQRLDSIIAATTALQEKIYSLRSLKADAKLLFSYYGSEDWYKDREANSITQGENVIKAGVLSEDLIYDSITELRDVAFTMLEFGT